MSLAAWRAVLVVPLATALTLIAAGGAASAKVAPGSVPPDRDPFYSAPARIAKYAPGQIVAKRSFTPKSQKLARSVRAWQLAYRTNDSHNRPELAVTTLFVPRKAWTGKGGRPIVSTEVAEDSTGIQCAPSYDLTTNTGIPSYAEPLFAKNWAVTVPDFEGPRSLYMVGEQAGHAVLDGARAVKNFRAKGRGKIGHWALWGYSGGADATGWAAQLQPSYAPDVRLSGAAMGGTPADPAAVARSLDGGLFSGFEFAATASLDAAFPEAGIKRLINARGRTDLANARSKCENDLLFGLPFRRIADDSKVSNPLSVPSVAAVLARNTLGAAAPATPIYNYHVNTDEIVPVGQENTLVKAWCARGVSVQSVRDLFGEHALEFMVRTNDVVAFLAARFAGKPPTSTC